MNIKGYKSGEDFLNKVYTGMHMENVVMHTAKKSDKPEEKIRRYLERLERSHKLAQDNSHKMKFLKKLYYDKYVIKQLPEGYVNLQKKIARNEGHGDIEVTDAMRIKMLEQIQKDQEKSLDVWIEYLSSDDAMYPMWFKNYAVQGMTKLGKFNKEKGSFEKRTGSTTSPYIELDRENLAQCYDVLKKTIERRELTEDDVKALKNGESFKKLYSYFLLNKGVKEQSAETEGIWKKYEQGENYQELWQSLQGKNTGWCTAGEETAKQQLEQGDFYVYYTEGEEGKYTEPRIAIRMNDDDEIAEVRGIAEEQNLEPNMIEIAEKKLDEFPDKEIYKKKTYDMKFLTEIDRKVKAGEELNQKDLRFLYEIDDKIEGFGWKKDPRIKEIIEPRDIKKDLSIIFECNENEIGTSIEELKKEVKVYYGTINDRELLKEGCTLDNLKSLEKIWGNATFERLTNAECLENLIEISGNTEFKALTNAKGLERLTNIGGDVYFDDLTDAKGLENLATIGGDTSFKSLTDAKGLRNLTSIGGNVNFEALINAEDLENLATIGGDTSFKSLTDAKGLRKLTRIGGYAGFESLTKAEDLKNLISIGNSANFKSLTDAKGLENLTDIGGSAEFGALTDAKGLENLTNIGYDAEFGALTDAKGLENLTNIGRKAEFGTLTDAKGLEKLTSIGGSAEFGALTDAEGLENLTNIGGSAEFGALTDAKGLENLTNIGSHAIFHELTNAEKLGNLTNIDGSAYFDSLMNTKGLENLANVGTWANFKFLREIALKFDAGKDLNQNDLRILYGIDNKIERFGWGEDPDTRRIIKQRDIKKDLSIIFECNENEIGISIEDLKKEIKVYYGTINDVELLEEGGTLDDLKSLEKIYGNVIFEELTNAECLENLIEISGNAEFSELTDAKGLKNLTSIGGYADFESLTNAEGLKNLTSIGGYADFESLTNAKGLKNLTSIGGDADFESLTNAEGLKNLTSIGGYADFESLTNAKGLKNLTSIGGDVEWGYGDFSELTSVEGLQNLNEETLNILPQEFQEQIKELKQKHKLEEFTEIIQDRNIENIDNTIRAIVEGQTGERQRDENNDNEEPNVE